MTCRPGGQCRPGSPAGLIRACPRVARDSSQMCPGAFQAGAVADRTWMKGTAGMTMLADTLMPSSASTPMPLACLTGWAGTSPRSPSGPIRGAARWCWPGLVSIPLDRGWCGRWNAPAHMAWSSSGCCARGHTVAEAGGQPAGRRGTRGRATRLTASDRHETHLDLPADLPLSPRCEKSASRLPRITLWVFFAALWVFFAAGPGRTAKRRRPGSLRNRPGRSRHSRRLPRGK